MELLANRVEQITCRSCGCRIDVAGLQPFSSVVCPGCRATLAVTAQLDQFDLIKILGTGSMGRVYLAMDRVLGRQVAIKVLRPAAGEGDQDLNSCLQEARALAALNHRNVAQIHAIQEKDGYPYIVMELVDGDRLDLVIDRQAPLDEVAVLRIAVDVARGLKAAHDVGLVHGDVKPGNILLDHEWTAKLVDFGVARLGGSERGQKAYGTPQYVAPEVVLKSPVNHRADIFSLGATVYHALAGVCPFSGETIEELLRARLERPAPDVRLTRANLQVETAAVVSLMLQLDPALRYQTYDDLIDALSEALDAAQSDSSSTSVAELDQALHEAKPVRRRRFFRARAARWPLVLMMAASVVLAGWIVVRLRHNAQQRAMFQAYQDSLPAAGASSSKSRWVNVLKRVDVKRDAVAGDWSLSGEGLVVQPSPAARLASPVQIGGGTSYEAQIAFSHQGGEGGVCVILPVGFHQAMLVLGGAGGRASGLQWIDGQAFEDNESAVGAMSMEQGTAYTLEVKVAVEGTQAQVDVSLQEKPYLQWSGDWARLDIQHPWGGLDPDALGLGASMSEVVFHRVAFRRLPVPEAPSPDTDGPALDP